jgi:uncharacterized membrane protein YhiD involved in acid resistance
MDEQINFQDVVKKSFSSIDFASTLSVSDIVAILLITFLMGMFIFYIYKQTFQGVLYTQSYNVSLVMVSIVTSLIIMTISSNFILSLGMVGALSIVRFRTAIKDSMDIVFMFWAISVGITNGAGLFKISLTGSLVIAAALLVLTRIKSKSSPYLLIVNYDDENHIDIMNYMKSKVKKYNLKAKTVANGNVELTIEIRINNDDVSFVNDLAKSKGIKNAVLVSYNGDYVS